MILHGSLIFTQAEEGEKLRGRFQESILLDIPPPGEIQILGQNRRSALSRARPEKYPKPYQNKGKLNLEGLPREEWNEYCFE